MLGWEFYLYSIYVYSVTGTGTTHILMQKLHSCHEGIQCKCSVILIWVTLVIPAICIWQFHQAAKKKKGFFLFVCRVWKKKKLVTLIWLSMVFCNFGVQWIELLQMLRINLHESDQMFNIFKILFLIMINSGTIWYTNNNSASNPTDAYWCSG